MPDDNFSQFATKKAYEISYALFRVAQILKNGSLAKQLEDQALRVLSTAILKDYAECRQVLNSTEYLLRLGTDVNLINPANSYLIINEIGNFNSAIAEFENTAKLLNLNLEPIFSKKPIPVDSTHSTIAQAIRGSEEPSGSRRGGERSRTTSPSTMGPSSEPQSNSSEPNGSPQVDNLEKVKKENAATKSRFAGFSEARQSAIFERIRQFGNCRLKDIQEFLPDVSDRTLRYDLQALTEQGLIEKVGTAGLSSHYQIRGFAS